MSAETFDDVAETFAFLDDWEDRYRYVIDLGREMPAMDDTLKSSLTKVDGCASQVWIAPSLEGEGQARRLHFVGDSDAMIVRGLIAVLRLMLSGRTPGEIVATDVEGRLAELGLDQHLSSQRSNGLRAMVARVRELARAAA
ncbi:MAG: SufE family protein [Pikeienuella sp.]|uniref:SufE family protein n=1 Tax=Pikeienuella sp. TaxID=2831957 RepID=UPI0039189803